MPRAAASLENLAVFCRTVELGSFTLAARALGLTPQAASRAVTRLEAAVGVALVRRSTRAVAPTELGRRYYERCREGLAVLGEATEQLSAGRGAVVGEVRISMPTTFGHFRLLPVLARLRALHPALRLVVHVSNHNVDFAREGFDLAVRLGEIDRASFVARSLGTYGLGLFASPSYLARAGTPADLDALLEHEAIVFARPSTGRVLPWELAGGRSITPRRAWVVAEDFLACLGLARAGAGIVQSYHFLVERDVHSGALVEVLPQHAGVARRFSLVYPKGSATTRAVRVVIDHVLEHLRPGRAGR